MAGYHIWHPAYVIAEPLTLECFVTLGDSLFLSRGTDAFAAAALQAIGVNEQPVSWDMKAMRTHYFSSYRESSANWEDRWALAWRLRTVIDVARAPTLPAVQWDCFDLEAADTSFHPDHRPQLAAGWPCLVIADAPEQATLESAKHVIGESFPAAECVWGKAFGAYPQLRCDLGYFERSYYERNCPEVEEALTKLQAEGAFVRFHGLERLRR